MGGCRAGKHMMPQGARLQINTVQQHVIHTACPICMQSADHGNDHDDNSSLSDNACDRFG